MPRLAFLTLVGALMGAALAWTFAQRFHLAWDAGVVLALIFAAMLGTFAYVVARR